MYHQRLHVATGIAQLFMALTGMKGCLIMLGGGVEEYLSHMQSKTKTEKRCYIPHVYEYPIPQEEDDLRIHCLIEIQSIIKW